MACAALLAVGVVLEWRGLPGWGLFIAAAAFVAATAD